MVLNMALAATLVDCTYISLCVFLNLFIKITYMNTISDIESEHNSDG